VSYIKHLIAESKIVEHFDGHVCTIFCLKAHHCFTSLLTRLVDLHFNAADSSSNVKLALDFSFGPHFWQIGYYYFTVKSASEHFLINLIQKY
jgi:hypothetical protein